MSTIPSDMPSYERAVAEPEPDLTILEKKEDNMADPQGMIPVENSSNVTFMGFRPKEQVLTVEFKNGKRYQYKDVSQEKFDRMQRSQSIGQFIQSEIKGRHECTPL